MSVKFSAKNVSFTVTQPQPGTQAILALFSVLGSPKVSIYTEPADLTLTGYTVRIGYKFGRTENALDEDRVLYSARDILMSQVKSVSTVLAVRQEEEGIYTEYRVPTGARQAYLWVACVAGAINYQVGSV